MLLVFLLQARLRLWCSMRSCNLTDRCPARNIESSKTSQRESNLLLKMGLDLEPRHYHRSQTAPSRRYRRDRKVEE